MANKKESHKTGRPKTVVNPAVRDYGSEPFFVKKANDSKQFLEEHGFPKVLRKNSGKA